MNLLKPIGVIDLNASRRDISQQSLLGLYWEFFDAAGYESHLLANDKLFRTVISNEIYPDLYHTNATYQLELNRRLIDLAWLYLTYKENENKECVFNPVNDPDKYRPNFHYSHESTYYFDDYSWVRMEFENGYKPFKREDDYKEVIYRFKGKVRWLSLEEIEDPYSFYRNVFVSKTHLDWIQLLSKWGEYTFLPQSICKELDGGEVYDTYVLFQKLTEMAYLVHHYDDYIPDSRKFLYFDFGEYPSTLNIDELISPQIVLINAFRNSDVEAVLNEMLWWLDAVLKGDKISDVNRVYDIYIKTLSLVEFCWISRPYKTQSIGLKRDVNKDDNAFYASLFETLNYQPIYLDEKEKLQPLFALNWGFSRYKNELGHLRSILTDCFESTFRKRSSSLDNDTIEKLKVNYAKFIELSYLFHLVLSQEKN